MRSTSNLHRIVMFAVVAVVFMVIGIGYAALNSASAAVGRPVCCCNNQCVQAVNGKCPTTGCAGPFSRCPDHCGTAL